MFASPAAFFVNRGHPMSRASDRNLLFGLLALQNNFIDRDGLLDAFQRWVNDRSTALDRILLDRGALSPGRHALLVGLVEEHLKLHDDDPEKSLAALSSIGSVREDLSRIADAGLQASLARVSAARLDGDGDDRFRTVSASLGTSTSAGSRFRILRPHAKGGLGQVSVALDQELDRPIALKEIQDRHADDPASRARFVQEAEITGKLEHPGIIPVYGLGHDACGRPFYAMRFIEGDSLGEAIRAFHRDEALTKDLARRGARLRELLRRFTDVCNAVAYAHSRGVLHRDLKPGNIMLGPYGETLVVDWGLAKPLGATLAGEPAADAASGIGSSITGGPIRLSDQSGSRSDTVAGSPIGTPAYASPEQVVGALDRLGPATDIYGLGATLYALLTGRPPVDADDLPDVLRRVQKGEIPPPRSLDPAIPRPLEAICLKAMALKPGNRYPTARALAQDVTRWLDDEPVSAYREPISVRTARWMRRHRTLVASTVAVFVFGAFGLAGFAMVLASVNRELDRQRQAAVDSEKRARDGEAKAKKSEAETKATLEFFQDKVLAAARPKDQEGGLGIEATIRAAVDAAEPTIEKTFAEQPAVAASIRDTLGVTYRFLGLPEVAIRQHESALALRRQVLGSDHLDTLSSMFNLAGAYENAGRLTEAISLLEEVLRRERSTFGPDHPNMLTTMNDLASDYLAAGRLTEAVSLHEETLKRFKATLGPDHRFTLTSMNNLALTYKQVGRLTDAVLLYEATLKRLEATLGPDHPVTLQSMMNLGVACRAVGRFVDARQLLEDALKRRKVTLGPDHPDTLNSMNNLASVYLAEGRPAMAVSLNEEVLKRRRVTLGPDHPATLTSMNNLAVADEEADRLAEATSLFEDALKRRGATLGPGHPDTLSTMNNLANAYRVAGQLDRAIPLLEQALKVQRAKLGEDHPDTLSSMNSLAATYFRAGRADRAIPLVEQALKALRAKLGADHPHTLLVMSNLARAYLAGQPAQAERLLREALTTREKTSPDDWLTFYTRSMLGNSLLGQKQFGEAEPLLLQGYEGLRAREAKIPGTYKKGLAEAGLWVIELYDAWGKLEEAAAWKAKLGIPDLPADVFAPAPKP
jgi:serine/threonine protein kinase/tetratricopeptide (TPR) repeat protein